MRQSGANMRQSGAKMPQPGAKMRQCGAKMRQCSPKIRQFGAKMGKSGANMHQSGAKMRQSGAKTRHLGPSWRHLEPSWVQLASPKLVLEPRGSRYGKVLFRGCKSAIRYAKVLFRGCKSAIRYAKTQNDLSPLWGRSDLGSLKHNTYATFFLTLHSLWGPSDFFLSRSAIQTGTAHIGFAWFCVLRVGAPSFGAGNLPAYRA